MKNRKVLWIGVVLVLIVAVYLMRNSIHFDWRTFVDQMRLANWRLFGVGLLLIYLAYVVRAVRWALFLRPTKKVGLLSLFGTQVIGFSAVAIFGRPADLVRPYLVSKRTNIPVAAQMAVWAVERLFDFASNAAIFAGILLLSPERKSLPHPEAVQKMAMLAAAAVVVFAIFAFFMRRSGEAMARMFGKVLGSLSPKLGEAVAEKILAFRDGLTAINSFGAFLQAAVLSLAMWMMIVYSYVETIRAFTASAPLANMTLPRCIELMVASQAASMIQLPIIGWFTQIGIVAKALQSLFGVGPEPELGAASMLLVITFLAVIPAGLIWARLEKVSLKAVKEESEHVAEEVAHHPHAGTSI